jgi:hypothetical protein
MSKGLIIPILERYEHILIENLNNLYNNLNFTLPVELWQIGNEISEEATEKIKELQLNHDITFENVQTYTDESSHWKGYQIKAFIVKYTTFDEVILCDCDVLFGVNPEIILHDTKYIETGCFLFKDYPDHYPKNEDEIKNRNQFIQKLIPIQNEFFPKEWDYVYTGKYEPIKHKWYYLESGVVYINKRIHTDVVNTLYELNHNWKETYQYVHGDKETFWLAFVMNKKPFSINKMPGMTCLLNNTKTNCSDNNSVLTHLYNNTYFFSQKGYPELAKLS